MRRKGNWLSTSSLVVLDAIMIAGGFVLAYALYLRTKDPLTIAPPFSMYHGMMAIHVATLLGVFFFYKLYHRRRSLSRFDEFTNIFSAVSIGTFMAIAFTAFIFNRLEYSRWIVVYAWMWSLVLVTLGRLIYATIEATLRTRGIGADRVLIVGAGEVGQNLAQRIERTPWLGYRVVGFVDDDPPIKDDGPPILGRTEDLSDIIERQGIDEVIVALPGASHEELMDIISRCHRERVSIKVFPDVFQIIASEVSIGHLDGLPLLTVRDVALRGWKLTLKRAVDMVVSSFVMILLSPIMLLIALAIKLDSRGPILYAQERMGLDAKPFQVIKFRSMRADAEAETGPVWATADDPRRTRVGASLRRLSLDELPQFINVLLGEMSVVGPRPERPVFVEQFRRSIPRYMDRHREKAGITGWAQVNGQRGDSSIWERTKYDIWYIENWSLWLDFKIILMTLPRLFRDRNAV